MKFPTATQHIDRDELVSRLTEHDVEAVYRALGVERFGPGGPGNWLVSRPWQATPETRPSVTIRKIDGVWSDLAKGEGGSLFDAVMRVNDYDFPEALQFVADIASVRSEPSNGHRKSQQPRRIVETYPYYDETGELLYEAVRYQPKDFSQRRPDGTGGWVWSLKGVRRVLYRLPELLAASSGRWVLIPEGEKDADRLRSLGFVATSVAGGAEAPWLNDYSETLRGRNVAILADRDVPGWKRALKVARALHGVAAVVKVIDFENLGPRLLKHGPDVSDWFDLGHTVGDLKWLVLDAPVWNPDAEPEPAPGEPEAIPPAPFPVDAIPEPMRSLVVDGAAALGAPPDFLGNPALGISGGIIGNTQRIQLKVGWEECPRLWLGAVGPPGSIKSPALKVVREPMEVLQREAKQRYNAEMAEYTLKMNAGEKADIPRLREYYVTDATMEAIHAAHEHEPGLSLIRDELVGWVQSHDAYRKGGDRSNWLSSWAGAPIKVNRKSSATPVYIYDPCITVVGGIQPDLLPELAQEAGKMDGFLDRMLWSYPETQPPMWNENTLDPSITEAVKKVFETLRSHERAANPVILSPGAKAAFVDWYNENAQAIQRVHGLAAGIYAKLPNQLARICLVIHCLSYPDNPPAIPVSAETMGDAIELVEYFRSHAHRVLPLFGSAAEQQAVSLRSRILRALNREPGAWVKRADLAIALGGHVPAIELSTALQDLEDEDVVESQIGETGPKGGRPPRSWRVKTWKRENPSQLHHDGDEWGEI